MSGHQLIDKENQWETVDNLRLLVSAIGYGLYSVNTEGRCTFANNTCVDLLGFDSTDELIGTFAHDLIHHTYADGKPYPAEQCKIYQATRQKLPVYVCDEVFWRKDRSSFPVEYWSRPILEEDTHIGCVVIFNDITDRLRVEAQREHLIEELESKNVELERFLYTASHDLKSPLVTIKGFAGAIQNEVSSGNLERIKQDAERISTAANKMQLLIDDLLHFSHVGQDSPIGQVSLANVLELVEENLKVIIESENVSLIVQEYMPKVLGNETRLVEVFQNLIENAIKFKEKGCLAKIEIGYFDQICEETGDKELIYFVKDNGIGIAEQYFDKVFNLFERLNPSTPGTGVGLAIVKRIINQHHGRIWIESNGVSKGTRFCFTLNTENLS